MLSIFYPSEYYFQSVFALANDKETTPVSFRKILRHAFFKVNLFLLRLTKDSTDSKIGKLEGLSAELYRKNQQLKKQYDEYCLQGERIELQNQLIELMNAELNSHSRKLEEKVNERTRELAHSNKLLQRYNENLEQYTFAISHQLKAPVSRMLGLTNLMRILPTQEQPAVIETLHSAAKELDTIFKELVHTLNLKHDASHVKIERVDVRALLQETWSSLKKNSTASLACHAPDDLVFETDKNHLTEAVSHIFSNALKFHRSESDTHVEADVVKSEGRIRIRIKDNGIGFDTTDAAARLFTPFSRFNITHPGRGMGLYLMKQHISILGGDVWIKSRVNNGTETVIELPLN